MRCMDTRKTSITFARIARKKLQNLAETDPSASGPANLGWQYYIVVFVFMFSTIYDDCLIQFKILIKMTNKSSKTVQFKTVLCK